MASVEEMTALVAAKRQRHPELRGPVTWDGFLRVCEREGVSVLHAPLPAEGVMLTALGSAVMVLNSRLPARWNTYRGVHELAHHWLHGELEPTVYTMSTERLDDPREDDAEYVTALLMQGWTGK